VARLENMSADGATGEWDIGNVGGREARGAGGGGLRAPAYSTVKADGYRVA
jgi:hypothetical protein